MVTKYDTRAYDLFAIERWQVERLQGLATRLFSENRMDGDEMRNAGQLVEGILRSAIPVGPDWKEHNP